MNAVDLPQMAELLGSPLCRQLTLALVHFLWQGLAIALLLALAVQVLGLRRARDRYAASLSAFVLMLLGPAATLVWLQTGEAPLAGVAAAHQQAETAAALPVSQPNRQFLNLAALQPYAFGAWLLGVTFFAARLAVGVVGIARLRRKLIPLPLDLASSVERLGARLSIEALPLVFLSKNVAEAMAVGLVRPLVLIPAAWATEMPLPMLEAVIAHELAHLRRHDLWVNLLQRIAETLLFYHPAVWWLSRRLRIERELCADELAVQATGQRLEYAEALEQVALRRRAEIRPALAAFMRGEKNMRLLERVRNVLGLAAAERSRLWPAGLLALALPLGLWAVSLGLTATADDERKDADRPKVEREREVERDRESPEAKFFAKRGDKEEGDAPRKDGDAPRKDGDAPRKDGARDGDQPRKDGPRDGEVKKEGARDVDRPRKEGPREGDEPRKEGERDGDRPRKDGEREGDGGIDQLRAMVKKLLAENERLRAELAAVRGGKEGVRKEGGEKITADQKFREAAERKEAQERERKEAIRKDLERKEGERAEGNRKEVEREGGERRERDRERAPEKEDARKEGDAR